MIEGVVNADYEAVITLAVRGPAGRAREIEAVIDTGYTGFLTLPPTLAADLQLPVVGPSEATLANGEVETFIVHNATVIWDGMPRDIEADAVGVSPLAGMSLLDRHSLYVEVEPGGRVLIRASA